MLTERIKVLPFIIVCMLVVGRSIWAFCSNIKVYNKRQTEILFALFSSQTLFDMGKLRCKQYQTKLSLTPCNFAFWDMLEYWNKRKDQRNIQCHSFRNTLWSKHYDSDCTSFNLNITKYIDRENGELTTIKR